MEWEFLCHRAAKAEYKTQLCTGNGDIALSKLAQRKARVSIPRAQEKVRQAAYKGLLLTEMESGTIEIQRPDGTLVTPTIEKLREIAAELGVSRLNSQGNRLNTCQLGTAIIRTIANLTTDLRTLYWVNPRALSIVMSPVRLPTTTGLIGLLRRLIAMADVLPLSVRQLLGWSSPLKVSLLARRNYRSWPAAAIAKDFSTDRFGDNISRLARFPINVLLTPHQ